jgi:adenylate kinase
MPIILRHALVGWAIVNSEDPVFERPGALAILIDIFSERGYQAVIDKNIHEVVDVINLQTGAVVKHTKSIYRIQVRFPGSDIRRG